MEVKNLSKGEEKIARILTSSNIYYQKEKTFHDLKKGQYRFDFYIPNLISGPIIIEYNGEQHYKFVSKFYKTPVEWRQAQGRDMRKISYCLSQHIPLYIIPYWEIDNIRSFSDLINPKYLAKDRYKNYIDYDNFLRGRH